MRCTLGHARSFVVVTSHRCTHPYKHAHVKLTAVSNSWFPFPAATSLATSIHFSWQFLRFLKHFGCVLVLLSNYLLAALCCRLVANTVRSCCACMWIIYLHNFYIYLWRVCFCAHFFTSIGEGSGFGCPPCVRLGVCNSCVHLLLCLLWLMRLLGF